MRGGAGRGNDMGVGEGKRREGMSGEGKEKRGGEGALMMMMMTIKCFQNFCMVF